LSRRITQRKKATRSALLCGLAVFAFSSTVLADNAAIDEPGLDNEGTPAGELVIQAAVEPHKKFGVALDVGVPEVIGASFLYSPLHWLTLSTGITSDIGSAGLRAGVTFSPWRYWIRPTVTLEGGYTFNGNATMLTKLFGYNGTELEELSYGYGNAHLGVEMGSERIRFFLRGGISYVSAALGDVEQKPEPSAESGGSSTTVVLKSPSLSYFGPTGKIGLAVYF